MLLYIIKSVMLMIYTFQYTAKQPSIQAGDNINRVDTQAGVVGKVWCLSVGEPMPHIKWYHFGQLLENNQTYKIQETERCSRQQSDNGDCEMGCYSELQVEVREEDVGWIYGIYTCRAINKMGSTNWEIDMREERGDPDWFSLCPSHLQVKWELMKRGLEQLQLAPRLVKPRIHPGDNYNGADTRPGLVINLTCLTVGEPMPHIKWYHSGLQLENNQTYKIHETERCSHQDFGDGHVQMGRYGVLQVTVPKEDEGWIYGNYTCRATNMMGSYDWRIHLGKESESSASEDASEWEWDDS